MAHPMTPTIVRFLAAHPDVAQLEWDGHEVSVWHDIPGATPCSASEFLRGSVMRDELTWLDAALAVVRATPMLWQQACVVS